MTRYDDLRAALDIPADAEFDTDKLAAAMAEILAADPNRVRFSVDAGMVARLGRELVARHETALSELVKNAYDADATRVEVHISGPDQGNYISISDNGLGMSRDTLVNGFMRLATTAKLAEPRSPRYGRRRAGRKGVGRFAAERLGDKLILTTATIDAENALQIEIEWDRFVAGADLSTVSLPILQLPKDFTEGTKLRIENLRDTWPNAAVERTFQHVTELMDPGNLTEQGGVGSDFFVKFERDGRNHRIVDLRAKIAESAFALISAEVDPAGSVSWSLQCNRLGINNIGRPLRVGENEQPQLSLARRAKLRAYYFIIDRANVAPTSFKSVQSFLAANGGIKLYRNGFRVPPYGDAGNDWLGLDLLSSQRSQVLAPIRNRNFLGSVSLEDDTGIFEELSSREGIVGSAAFEELSRAMTSALLTGVREIDAERARRSLKRDKPTLDLPPQAEADGNLSDDLQKAVFSLRRQLSSGDPLAEAFETISLVEEKAIAVAALKGENEALLKEIDLLRVLASMGLAVGQFTHEFSTLSGVMRSDVTILLEEHRTAEERVAAAKSLRALLNQARDFTGLFKSMTEGNAMRERGATDLYEAATSFRSAMATVLDRNSVVIEIDDAGLSASQASMHRSEIFAILLNLTTNSIKAIKRARVAGRILVRLSEDKDGSLLLDFHDNGDGIASEVADTMFDAFVTTTAASGAFQSDDDLAMGSGLGLAIVKDILNAAGGQIFIGEASSGFSTCLRVIMPNGATL